MVKTSSITESNTRFASEHHEDLVCVFVGAISGIGMGTLRKMVTMLYSSTFYILGRSGSRFSQELEAARTSPSCKIVFLETELSLISGIDLACERILSKETRVDLLFMSPGDAKEGLELCFALSYNSRLRMVSNLLPLLRQSPHPRVLSILNGTKEKKVNENDLGLEKEWGVMAVVNHTTICTSLAFDYLATNDAERKFTIIHATQGFVKTGIPRTTYPSKRDGYLWWAFVSVMQVVSDWIIVCFCMDLKESRERHSYHLTSDTFIPGSWQTNRLNEIVPANSVLKGYQERASAEKV